MPAPPRDDFFTLIHKALRSAFLELLLDAGRLDWSDRVAVEGFHQRWTRMVALLRSHAGHEDEFIWPLLESKRPGSIAELGIGHELVDADIDALDELFGETLDDPTPAKGLTFYRALCRFSANSLEHFSLEEPAAMELLWATCTDEELGQCRAGFMATIPPQEAGWTFEHIMAAASRAEQAEVIGGLRASMPPDVFTDWLSGVEQTTSPETYAKLQSVLDDLAAHAV